MIKIFIGFDSSQPVAYHVCCQSIISKATNPLSITPLAINTLMGYTESHNDGSNDFIYSRFLVPHLCSFEGWAIYIDGDMILKTDIAKLWELKDESKAVLCVHHNYLTNATQKYQGAKNENYERKNWSSVILWNCSHPSNRLLNPEFIQKSSGKTLHRFMWLEKSQIGELPIEWNWLPDEFGENDKAKLLHFTLGTPCFEKYANSPMAELWHDERFVMNSCNESKT